MSDNPLQNKLGWLARFAATTCAFLLSQVLSWDDHFIAAIAKASPPGSFRHCIAVTDDGQKTEALPGNVGSVFMFDNWRFDRSRKRPAEMVHSATHQLNIQRQCFAPFCDSFRLLHVLDTPVISPVVRLFSARCPSAVRWLVVSIAVDPVKRAAFWPFSHIAKKILKVSPALAHSNSTPAVNSISSGFWVRASLDHSDPCAVFTGANVPVFRDLFTMETAATTELSRTQVAQVANDDRSALTQALPIAANAYAISSRNVVGEFEHNKSPEFLASQIYLSHNNPPLFAIVTWRTMQYKGNGSGG